ncbi:MAG TPA: uracil-DNA glycosylase [Ramlibacter sp.]|nr:uracil-DNA glycosylase [Ramlibacter sp.]
MSLHLDARQRAMLAEMGLHVYGPPAEAVANAPEAPEAAPVRLAPAPSGPRVNVEAPARPAAPRPAPSPVREPASSLESMGWDELAGALAEGRACPRCAGRPTVLGAGDPRAELLIVGDPPEEDEEREGEPFRGQAGMLLDNMLKAVGLDRHRRVYLTHVMKSRPPGNRNPEPQDLEACEPVLRRQVQLLQPRVILVMGRFAAPFLLKTSDPLGKLRGRAHDYLGVPVVATFHPTYLLRNQQDKAKAWADLCLARQLMAEPDAV